MFVFLSKFLPPFVYPLGLACILILLALVRSRLPGWRKACLAAALLLLWLGSNRWTAMSLARALEWQYLPQEEYPAADAIVVLGGGTQAAETPRQMVELNGAGDRLLQALQLYHQGKAPHLLLSGGTLGWSERQSSPAEEMASVLEMLGVPADALWLEPESRNTYENAVNSAEILREKGLNRILLVTSAWHMPRAVRLFEAQGLEVIPAPVDFVVTQEGWQRLWQPDWRTQIVGLLPNADSLALTTLMLKEHLGLLVYQLRGWE